MSPSPDTYLHYEVGSRPLRGGWSGTLITSLAVAWSIFQLALPQFLILRTETVRSIHLAFALALAFLCFPAARRPRTREWITRRAPRLLGWIAATRRASLPDLLLAFLAAASALYLALDFQGIAERLGRPSLTDMTVGVVLLLLLLEAARRSLGLALPLVASTFILYSFVSESMPDLIAFRNVTLDKLLTKLTLTTEGIYGVPLDVSASVVFLFVLFGAMLEKAGGGKYFIDLAYSLLGRYRGGPAKAAVLASGMTGMVNGSSIANTVTTGTFTIPLMKRAGFPAVKAGAVEVAASTNGQLMPPIMGAAAFIIAEYCNLTYLEVIRAAFIPAVISYLALLWIVHLEAGKLGLKGIPRSDLPSFRAIAPRGLHFLIPLALLLAQLLIFRRSAQLSVYTAILALAALMAARHLVRAARHQSTWTDALRNTATEWFDSLVTGARNMIGIGVAVAAAGIIVGVVTMGLGHAITDVISVLSGGNLFVMLLITAVVSLILGMGLPTTANYIVMASLTAPALYLLADLNGYAVPLIAAHLFVFYFGILSDDTPPVGLSAYAASAISLADPIQTGIQGFIYDIRTALLPFMFFFNTELLLIGVQTFSHGLIIFTTGLIAMFAFTSLIQGYYITRNRWYEGIILALVTLILLRPGLFDQATPLGRPAWYAIGLTLWIAIALLQSRRGQPLKTKSS
ncbi:MAG TPA: TRAP transporter permease [Kiritimatiellia bacterium]|nr:TRAP transporter permease [Kiritimatiellia bacterium]